MDRFTPNESRSSRKPSARRTLHAAGQGVSSGITYARNMINTTSSFLGRSPPPQTQEREVIDLTLSDDEQPQRPSAMRQSPTVPRSRPNRHGHFDEPASPAAGAKSTQNSNPVRQQKPGVFDHENRAMNGRSRSNLQQQHGNTGQDDRRSNNQFQGDIQQDHGFPGQENRRDNGHPAYTTQQQQSVAPARENRDANDRSHITQQPQHGLSAHENRGIDSHFRSAAYQQRGLSSHAPGQDSNHVRQQTTNELSSRLTPQNSQYTQRSGSRPSATRPVSTDIDAARNAIRQQHAIKGQFQVYSPRVFDPVHSPSEYMARYHPTSHNRLPASSHATSAPGRPTSSQPTDLHYRMGPAISDVPMQMLDKSGTTPGRQHVSSQYSVSDIFEDAEAVSPQARPSQLQHQQSNRGAQLYKALQDITASGQNPAHRNHAGVEMVPSHRDQGAKHGRSQEETANEEGSAPKRPRTISPARNAASTQNPPCVQSITPTQNAPIGSNSVSTQNAALNRQAQQVAVSRAGKRGRDDVSTAQGQPPRKKHGGVAGIGQTVPGNNSIDIGHGDRLLYQWENASIKHYPGLMWKRPAVEGAALPDELVGQTAFCCNQINPPRGSETWTLLSACDDAVKAIVSLTNYPRIRGPSGSERCMSVVNTTKMMFSVAIIDPPYDPTPPAPSVEPCATEFPKQKGESLGPKIYYALSASRDYWQAFFDTADDPSVSTIGKRLVRMEVGENLRYQHIRLGCKYHPLDYALEIWCTPELAEAAAYREAQAYASRRIASALRPPAASPQNNMPAAPLVASVQQQNIEGGLIAQDLEQIEDVSDFGFNEFDNAVFGPPSASADVAAEDLHGFEPMGTGAEVIPAEIDQTPQGNSGYEEVARDDYSIIGVLEHGNLGVETTEGPEEQLHNMGPTVVEYNQVQAELALSTVSINTNAFVPPSLAQVTGHPVYLLGPEEQPLTSSRNNNEGAGSEHVNQTDEEDEYHFPSECDSMFGEPLDDGEGQGGDQVKVDSGAQPDEAEENGEAQGAEHASITHGSTNEKIMENGADNVVEGNIEEAIIPYLDHLAAEAGQAIEDKDEDDLLSEPRYDSERDGSEIPDEVGTTI